MKPNSVEFFNKNKYQLPQGIDAPIVVACYLKTPQNYGNLIRLADTVGCSKVVFITNGVEVSDQKIRKTAGDSFLRMKTEYIVEAQLKDTIPEKYRWIALETAESSHNIFKTDLPSNMALFVGNEKGGISPELLARCHQIVHIPMTGNCTC